MRLSPSIICNTRTFETLQIDLEIKVRIQNVILKLTLKKVRDFNTS